MFLETICIQNGVAQNMQTHADRMRETAAHFGFRAPLLPDIARLLPHELRHEKVKCRILYREQIDEIYFEKYKPRIIRSLKLVEASPDYAFKFADRNAFAQLLTRKGTCDEILIVRHDCITDTSYSNVVFRKGHEFFTPDTYLLNGTKRQKLLREQKIRETRITQENLHTFDSVFLINAMLDVEDGTELSVAGIEK